MYEKLDLIVNKDNALCDNYKPIDLIDIDNNENNFHDYLDPNHMPFVRKVLLPDLLRMESKALKDGHYLYVCSAYRSYEYQKLIWDNSVETIGLEKTKNSVAYPGTSEHQTGLAIDFGILFSKNKLRSLKESDIHWLENNSYKYGFILRYPDRKENITGYKYEPWHYRYVGVKLAEYLKKENLVLEEYHLEKLNDSSLILNKKKA